MLGKYIMRLISVILFAIFTSTTVYGDTDNQSKKLTDFAYKNKVGNQDYLLQIETSYGWENVALFFGYNERFNGTLRNEILNANWFQTTCQAQATINRWIKEYNHIRPHQSLGMRPPIPETTTLKLAQIKGA